MIDTIYNFGHDLIAAHWWTGLAWPVVWALIKIVPVVAILLTAVLFLVLWERKFIGWLQVRPGPNRLGPWGLIQTMADALKLLTKEVMIPAKVDKTIYFLGPLLAVIPALSAWAVLPFGPEMVIANVNAGILLLMAITSMEIYAVLIAGWSSNSKYPLLGALRASAQMVSYELSISFCFVVIIMVSGSMHIGDIVAAQGRGIGAGMGLTMFSWNWLPLLPICVIYFICGLAECSRLPFDAVEGEAEIVAGHMVEYSGMGFALFFLAEYMNMWLISMITVLLFLGGWLPPFAFLDFIPGWIWLAAKVCFVVTIFVWVRGSVPRFRYDQTMRLGWKFFIPLTLIGVLVVAFWLRLPTPFNIWI